MQSTRFILTIFLVFGFAFSTWAQIEQPSSNSMAVLDSNTISFQNHILTGSQLNILPFQGEVQDYYGLFSGTVVQDYRGQPLLHVRGSRHDELGYTFEGADVRSAYSGLNLIPFIPEALERIELNSAPSVVNGRAPAILQHRLRRGGADFNINLWAESDRFTNKYHSRLDTYSYGYSDYILTTEGKLFSDNIRFFAAGEGEFFNDHYRKFWDGFRVGGSEFPLTATSTDQPLEEVTGADEIVVQPGNIPNASSERYTLNSIITADFEPLYFRLVAAHNHHYQQQNDTPIRDMFVQERVPDFRKNASLLSLQTNYHSKNELSTHLQLDLIRSNEKLTDPLFDDNFLLYTDSLALAEKNLTLYNNRFFQINNFWFEAPGDYLADYTKMQENSWRVHGSIHKKLGAHKFSLGGSFKRESFRRFRIGSLNGLIRQLAEGSDTVERRLEAMTRGNVQAIGYDLSGSAIEETGEIFERPRRPIEYSAFVEEAFDTKGLRIQAGLRFDAFNTDALIFPDPENPSMDENTFGGMERAPIYHSFLPRFSTTYMPNNRINLRFSHGKFLQQVRLRDVYASAGHLNRLFIGASFNTDPRAFDAEPVRSTQSEIGFSYKIKPELDLSILAFNKSTKGYLETIEIETDPSSPAASYSKFENSGESVSSGLELSLDYHNSSTFMRINYTLSKVRGYGTYPISNLLDVERSFVNNGIFSKRNPPAPLEYNQTHRASGIFSYTVPETAQSFLRRTGIHLLFRFNSGHDFLLYDGVRSALLYDTSRSRINKTARITTPWNYQFDFKLDKTLNIAKAPVKIFIYIQNVFNKKNIQHVYWRTGNANNDGSLESYRKFRSLEFIKLYELINYSHQQHYASSQGGDLFGRPREIRFGAQVGLSFSQNLE